jgi:dolichol-phosphate mannosyltransferase
MKKLISIVLPVFNEESNLNNVYHAITQTMDTLGQPIRYDYEIIFVNDGSRDRSWEILTQLTVHDSRVRAIKLSRNFGTKMG